MHEAQMSQRPPNRQQLRRSVISLPVLRAECIVAELGRALLREEQNATSHLIVSTR